MPVGQEVYPGRSCGPGVGLPDATLPGPPTECEVSWYAPVKIALDLTISICLLVISSPLILVLLILVKLTSDGPALYRQDRLGLHGRTFTILKLRTMRVDAEALTGPTWAAEDDPRVTPLGRILRRTHLDELPQLWNVVRGEMSLVGPRPERPEIAGKLELVIPGYRDRTCVRPGITGMAQIQLPADSHVGGVRRKLAYDIHYARRVGPGLDARILAGTALKLLGIDFGEIGRLLALPRRKVVLGDHPPLVSEHDEKTLHQLADALS